MCGKEIYFKDCNLLVLYVNMIMLLKSVFFLDDFDSDILDVKDLKKYGVLIFIFDSKMEMWGRMEYIVKFGNFGDLNYVKFID